MASDLSWNLNGNDELSTILEKLNGTLAQMSRKFDSATADAKQFGKALGDTERDSKRAADGLDSMGKQADQATSRLGRLAVRARETGAAAREHLDGVGGRLATVGQAALQMGSMVTIGAAAATVALGTFALKAAADNETAAISFEVLLGSAEKSQRFLEKIQKFANDTPFDMPELREASSRLLAVGISAERIIPILTKVGDAAAGMGTGAEGMGRAIYAMQQVWSSGVAQMDDLNQLSDAGLPIFDALAAHYKVSVMKLRKELVPAGKVTADALFSAIEAGEGAGFARLNGMMDRQSKTLAGIWSSFLGNAGQAAARFAEPLVPAAKKTVDWMATNLPKGVDKLLSMGREVKEIFKDSPIAGEFKTALKELAEKVVPALNDAWKTFTDYLTQNKDKVEHVAKFITDIAIPVFGTAFVLAVQSATGIVMGFIDVADQVVSAWSWATRIVLELIGFLGTAAAAALSWVPGLGPTLDKAATDFEVFAGRVKTKLDELDGRHITVGIDTIVQSFSGKHSSGGGPALLPNQMDRRASGGPVWAGRTYQVDEQGIESFYAAQTGVIMDANRTRSAMAGGSSGGVIGVLRVVHETPDGQVIREELLTLKRSRGLTSLGLT